MNSSDTKTVGPRRTRVVVLGPVLPFRGGIAQHTTMLTRALSSFADCRIYSFHRLYPRLVFPGDNDRDGGYEGHSERATEYVLDTLNPLSWYLTLKKILRQKPDLVLIPWWTFYLGFIWWYFARCLRRQGIDVVFLCHNVFDHEDSFWKHTVSRLVLGQACRHIVQSELEAAKLKALIPNSTPLIHPHPIYKHFPIPDRLLPRRAGLELLFFGFVRPYKGLNVMLEALGLLKGEDVFLTVAGEFWRDLEYTRRSIIKLGIDSQVELRPYYHSESESASLFERSDIVVFPYLSATGSGVATIAYRYRKPILVTNVGGLSDVVVEGKTGWTVPPGDAAPLAENIRERSSTECAEMAADIEVLIRDLSWESLALTILK